MILAIHDRATDELLFQLPLEMILPLRYRAGCGFGQSLCDQFQLVAIPIPAPLRCGVSPVAAHRVANSCRPHGLLSLTPQDAGWPRLGGGRSSS